MKKQVLLFVLTCIFIQTNYTQNLDLKVFLEGPYQSTTMSTLLNSLGYIPLDQPYNTTPWDYDGIENLEEIPTVDVVDWILYELHDATDANSINETTRIERKAALLNNDGQVTDLNGISLPAFSGTIVNDLYVIIRHRNHLDIISAFALQESGGTYSYDFSTGESQVLGHAKAHKDLGSGVWGMLAGDGNSDSQTNNPDKNDIWYSQQNSSGYLQGDYNMDGQANMTDKEDFWLYNAGYGMRSSKVNPDFECGDDLVDDRDGKSYITIQIGSQCWMAENLNVGIRIDGSENQTENSPDEILEKYCYDDLESNCVIYGGLYQWNEMMQYTTAQGIQGICPQDWHLPTDEEMKELEGSADSFYGYPDAEWDDIGWRGLDAAIHLKSTSGWNSGGNGDNLSGFAALPGGYRYFGGSFTEVGEHSLFWATTLGGSGAAWGRRMYHGNPDVDRDTFGKVNGLSVRCLQD